MAYSASELCGCDGLGSVGIWLILRCSSNSTKCAPYSPARESCSAPIPSSRPPISLPIPRRPRPGCCRPSSHRAASRRRSLCASSFSIAASRSCGVGTSADGVCPAATISSRTSSNALRHDTSAVSRMPSCQGLGVGVHRLFAQRDAVHVPAAAGADKDVPTRVNGVKGGIRVCHRPPSTMPPRLRAASCSCCSHIVADAVSLSAMSAWSSACCS